MSQCLWEDGLPTQLTAILSPSYSHNSTSTSSPSSKHVDPGVIAGAVIAVVVVLAAACVLTYYLRRRRNQRVSTSPTENIALSRFNNQDEDKKSISLASGSPFPADSKPDLAPSIHSQYRTDGEIGTQGEIFQLPAHDNRDEDYFTAAIHIASERRAANTPEIEGTGIMYELHGSEPAPVEMDDVLSREGLSPSSAPSRGPSTRISSRTNGPLSTYQSI